MTSDSTPRKDRGNTAKAIAPLLAITAFLIPMMFMFRATLEGGTKDIVTLIFLIAIVAAAASPAFTSRCAGREGDGGQAS